MNAFILAAEAGHEANSFLLPHDINEVIWGSISFLLVIGLIAWKGGPAIKTMWAASIDKIRTEVETAESARTAAEAELATVEANIADAETERQRILSEGRETADAVKAQIIERAGTDSAELRARGAADVASSRSQASGDLQAEIGVLALGAAEAVVAKNLDAATHNDLIESYINRVGAGS